MLFLVVACISFRLSPAIRHAKEEPDLVHIAVDGGGATGHFKHDKTLDQALGIHKAATTTTNTTNTKILAIPQPRWMINEPFGDGHTSTFAPFTITLFMTAVPIVLQAIVIVAVVSLHKPGNTVGVGSILCALCCCPGGLLALCKPIDAAKVGHPVGIRPPGTGGSNCITASVVCPFDAAPGSMVPFISPDGRQLQTKVPAGIKPGQIFTFTVEN